MEEPDPAWEAYKFLDILEGLTIGSSSTTLYLNVLDWFYVGDAPYGQKDRPDR